MEFLPRWSVVTIAAAALATALDAVLLQRSKSFFTGGFLSGEHLHGAGEIALFLLVSLIADAAVIGVLAAVAMVMLARARVAARACTVAGFVLALLPLAIADVASYELVRYLGDAVDLSLMFDLTGHSIGEFFAVASSHVLGPAILIVAAGGAAGGFIWAVHRYSDRARIVFGYGALLMPAAAVIVGLVIVTAAMADSAVLEDGVLRKPSGRALTALVNTLTDFDRDGFGMSGRLTDPDLFNAAVFPFAVDLPGDGIDQDGVGGDLPRDTPSYIEPPVASTPWAQTPDVVLVVLESFRADVVGSRESGQQVTPVLEALAGRGMSSQRAYSHNGYTAQSRFHLLSGSLAGVRDGRTLVDDFKRNGYHTAYFSGQDESFGGAQYDVGFDRADVKFDARADPAHRYSTFTTAGSLAVPFSIVQLRLGEFLQRDGGDPRPLFLYVNFHDTHFPYWHEGVRPITSAVHLARASIAPEQREALRSTYANTAANVDRAIGEVLDAVERARHNKPAVIVTADHGESLFDEGFLGHGYALNDVQTRIPFIAANLPVVVPEPFGEDDLRDVVNRALQQPLSPLVGPRVQRSDRRQVFQYLGTLDRPRQIASLNERGRTIYDFRTRRFQTEDGTWHQPDEVRGTDRDAFLSLVHYWERMILARRARGGYGS